MPNGIKAIIRPDGLTDKHLTYLDKLKESGTTNMFGAAPILAKHSRLDILTARMYLGYWMITFGDKDR
jgi:hypothetical protein